MRCDVGLRRRGWGLPWRIGSVPPKLGIVEAWCQTAPVMSGAEARTLEAWKLTVAAVSAQFPASQWVVPLLGRPTGTGRYRLEPAGARAASKTHLRTYLVPGLSVVGTEASIVFARQT